jgi:amino acid transporter
MRNRQEFIRYLRLLSVLAFSLHLLWEVVQCPIFFESDMRSSTWTAMVAATLGDVLVTWTICGSVAAVSRNWRWSRRRWRPKQWVTLGITAIVIASAVESWGIQTGRWRYRDAMPVVPWFGIGVVPILQVLLLTPLVIALTERLVGGRGVPPDHRAAER